MHAHPPLTHDGSRPVAEEADVPFPRVLGHLPAALDGRFLRIGPNPLGGARDPRRHALAGDPMVHGLRIRDGAVAWYRNRWLRTGRVCAALDALPTPGPRHGLSEDCGGNLLWHAGRLFAIGDGGVLPVELDAELRTVARSDFGGTLAGGFGAHPERDPLTGELLAMAYSHEEPYLRFVTVGPDGSVRGDVPIDVKFPSMVHAFSLTERYAVVYDLPVRFDPCAAASGSRIPYTWHAGHEARLGVLDRASGGTDVLWIDIEPCYVFHALNAYEEGGLLTVDVVRHARVFDRDRLGPGESEPTLWRWTVDPVRGTVAQSRLSDVPQEFPRVDDRFRTLRHRYGFATAMDRGGRAGPFAGPALLRHDLRTGRLDVHRYGRGRVAGEAVFVPRSESAPEGDGWLLSLLYDASTDLSELIVLDTEDFTGEPAARVPLPVRAPHALHSAWIPAC